jgi:uncharacterized membrane protein
LEREALNRIAGTYTAVLLVMLALDALWLGVVAKPLYQQAIGHLMAEQPRLGMALLFYAVYAAGITVFGVWPEAATPGWQGALRTGALFGFFCYATYDLTNLATLKGWPVGIALIDMAWGAAISGISAAAGKLALDRLSA